MLSKILSKSDCASCKFCCSFRRQSLWETPLFSKEEAAVLKKEFPHADFIPAGKDSLTINLLPLYKTDDSEEEVACPFLDPSKGCLLPKDEKPFDCSIWPLRAVKNVDGKIKVKLTPTCPAISRLPLETVKEFVKENLAEKIITEAKARPDMVKEDSEFFVEL